MKRILAFAIGLLLSAAAAATTLSPIQLLNPTGSSSGQAILSTGASGAPAWGNVSIATLTGILPVANGGTNASSASGTALDNITGFSATGFLTRTGAGAYAFQSATNGITLGNLAQAAANTVLANGTGSTANITAFSMPSCSTSASALNWTTSTGFTCNTAVNAAQLGGQTFTSPTITTPTINGVTNGSAAAAGSVGQPLTNTSGAISLTTATAANTATVTLTAGDWDVYASCSVVGAGSTSITATACGLSATSATLPSSPLTSGFGSSTGLSGGAYQSFEAPTQQFNVSSSTPVWTVCSANFTVSTATCTGYIFARRRH